MRVLLQRLYTPPCNIGRIFAEHSSRRKCKTEYNIKPDAETSLRQKRRYITGLRIYCACLLSALLCYRDEQGFLVRVSGGEAASQLCDVPGLPRDTVEVSRIEKEESARTRLCRNLAVHILAGSKGGLSPWQFRNLSSHKLGRNRAAPLVADRSRRNPLPTGAPHWGEFQNAPGERFERGACPAREGRPFEGIDELPLKPPAA